LGLSSARGASASPTVVLSPSGPVPSSLGTGLSSQWVNGSKPADYEELDTALSFLTPTSFALDGVGPVSLSNNLKPLGDFANHMAMPYSVDGIPQANGWYLASRMTGAWAARQPGTYTFALGSDDGYRVILGGVVLLNHPQSQDFHHNAASFLVTEAGLYPITVEYFNGVEEGAIELSFAPGEVALDADVSAPVPSVFALIPLSDLYPPRALGSLDGGVPSLLDGGTDDASSAAEDASVVPPSDGSDVPEDGGGARDDEHWHGGGCSLSHTVAFPGWLGTVVMLLLAASFRRSRAL
jgi:hypothetical protein